MSLTGMRRKMQYALPMFVWAFVVIFIVGAFAAFNPFNAGGPTAGPSEGLFARVDGKEVTNREFGAMLEREREQIRQFSSYGGQPVTIQQIADTPRYTYERLLQEYAEAAAAEAAGVRVSESDAAGEARRQIDQHLQQVGQGSTPQELSEMRSILLNQIDTPSVRRQLLSQKFREMLTREARPVEVQAQHILIKPDKRTPQQAFQLAQTLAGQARAGADFSKLVQQHSDDTVSKANNGIVGWASAMPSQPTGPKAPRSAEAATGFVPEFTAAALRLKPGQVSDPVRSSFGFHVIRVVKERDYQPSDPAAQKDPKKRDEAVQQYRSTVANQVASGLTSEQRNRLEATLDPQSPWLKGFLAERAAEQPPAPVAGRDPKDGKAGAAPGAAPGALWAAPGAQAQRLAPAIQSYAQALKGGDPASGPGLAYKLAQLYERTGQHEQALEVLEKWARRSGDGEMYLLQGETLQKLKKNTDALEAYRQAMDKAYNNPGLLLRVGDKFKELGRADLAEQAKTKQAQQLTRQAAEQKRREEEMKKMMAQQAAESKAAARITTTPAAKPGAKDTAAGGRDGSVQEFTVKTGDIDPKTGKPKILSVTPGAAKPDDKAAEKAAEKSTDKGAAAAPKPVK